jgi:hypothetical protein
MKIPVIIAVVVVSIALSFAAGAYLSPPLFHHTATPASLSVPISPTPTANTTSVAPTAASEPSSSGEAIPGDLPTILRETNAYRLNKELTAYAEKIPVADMPKEIEAPCRFWSGAGSSLIRRPLWRRRKSRKIPA